MELRPAEEEERWGGEGHAVLMPAGGREGRERERVKRKFGGGGRRRRGFCRKKFAGASERGLRRVQFRLLPATKRDSSMHIWGKGGGGNSEETPPLLLLCLVFDLCRLLPFLGVKECEVGYQIFAFGRGPFPLSKLPEKGSTDRASLLVVWQFPWE